MEKPPIGMNYFRLRDDDSKSEVLMVSMIPTELEKTYKEYKDWCAKYAVSTTVLANSFSRWLVDTYPSVYFIMPIQEFKCE